MLSACGAGWCVGDTRLDVGSDMQLDGTAAEDFDADNSRETNRQQLDDLVGESVDLLVARQSDGTAVVYTVNGLDYRLADGTFA